MTLLLFSLFVMGDPGLTNQAPPRFHIETIKVKGGRPKSHRLIVTESYLKEGQSYTEKQLQAASQRIARLPFVLDINFSLEKGSQRDFYRLVIAVVPTRSFFFNGGLEYFEHEDGFDRSLWFGDVGWRWFLGSSGSLFASIGGTKSEGLFETSPRLAVGYSHHNLFGKNVFFSLSLTEPEDLDLEPSSSTAQQRIDASDSIVPHVKLSVPVGVNQWIKGDFQGNRNSFVSLGFARRFLGISEYLRFGNQISRAFWEFNTVNDSFLPTEGTTIQAGLEHLSGATKYFYFDPQPDPEPTRSLSAQINHTTLGVFARYQTYRGLADRIGMSYGGLLGFRTTDRDQVSGIPHVVFETRSGSDYRARANFGLFYDLWGRRKTRQYGDFRVELVGNVARVEFESLLLDDLSEDPVPIELNFGSAETVSTYDLNLRLTFRNSWGLISLAYQYYGRD